MERIFGHLPRFRHHLRPRTRSSLPAVDTRGGRTVSGEQGGGAWVTRRRARLHLVLAELCKVDRRRDEAAQPFGLGLEQVMDREVGHARRRHQLSAAGACAREARGRALKGQQKASQGDLVHGRKGRHAPALHRVRHRRRRNPAPSGRIRRARTPALHDAGWAGGDP